MPSVLLTARPISSDGFVLGLYSDVPLAPSRLCAIA